MRYSSAGEKERDTETENEEDTRKAKRRNPILVHRIAIVSGKIAQIFIRFRSHKNKM